ncbi:MAG TPA: GTPase ObgE [Vicinamibacteria bacterium]
MIIRVEGGTGGSGAEAFRHEAMNPRGGPSGGDGGDGGDVLLVCDPQLSTLLDFKYRKEYRAERGAHGEGNDRAGRDGEDIELRAPPGTIVRDAESGDLLGELLHEGESMVLAAGGRGGRGNARFATPTRQAPRHWEPGEEGEARKIELTLKLIADVGLVGKPNAGKSTFLAAVSAARPKVADYPFTTLTPNLGVVELSDFRSFVVADIPGVIQGAHEGRGLGHRFLQHIERTRTLALLIPCDDPDPQTTYSELREELARYSEELAERPHCIVLTKADLIPPEAAPPEVRGANPWGVFVISSVTGTGVEALLEALWGQVARRRAGSEENDAARTDRSNDRADGDTKSTSSEEAWWNLAEEEA